ncbi:MAG TPA: phosphoribosyltransferase family protein [Vitreimonas sp.]|nr:phosphoribosyltransferase family protein [Vitreimonas sp.]
MQQPQQITLHDQAYEFYPWNQLGEDIFELSKKILDSGQKFDRLIALAKGGLTFSRSLVDYLEIPDVSSIKIEFYGVVNTINKTPIITQSLPVSIRNEKILVFDDIVDKGETMKLAKQYLSYHGAESVTTACLISKPWSHFKPDFWARESEAWIIFPNEVRETIAALSESWGHMGDSPEEIRSQLLNIGFSEKEVALFAQLK